MTLAIDYRPKTLDEVIGQDGLVKSIKSIFNRESDFPHAWCFYGAFGSGKTTLAKIVANFLGPVGKDFLEINAANDNGIATARMVMEGMKFKPKGKARVYLIEEAHKTTDAFQNSILTTLEEGCPKHAYFIFCTTRPDKLDSALFSRLTKFEVKPLTDKDMKGLIESILRSEKIEEKYWPPKDVMTEIIDAAEGHPRTALEILDKIIDMEPEDMKSAIFGLVTKENKDTADLFDALTKKESWKGIVKILSAMDLSNHESIRCGIIGLAASKMMKGEDASAMLIYDCFKEPFFNNRKSGFIFAVYRAFLELSA